MANRLAGVLGLVVFAVCIIGGLRAENSFSTTITRALVALGGTYVIGLVIGLMAQKMLDENLAKDQEKLKELESKIGASDR